MSASAYFPSGGGSSAAMPRPNLKSNVAAKRANDYQSQKGATTMAPPKSKDSDVVTLKLLAIIGSIIAFFFVAIGALLMWNLTDIKTDIKENTASIVAVREKLAENTAAINGVRDRLGDKLDTLIEEVRRNRPR